LAPPERFELPTLTSVALCSKSTELRGYKSGAGDGIRTHLAKSVSFTD